MKRPAPTKTAASTIDAIMCVLRGGLPALRNDWLLSRFEDCDRAAIEEIKSRLLDMRSRSKGARPNWSVDDVAKVVALWESVQNKNFHDYRRSKTLEGAES
jgi:hypothetical protein